MEQGSDSKLTAKSFFIENNPNGIVNATPFMDYYEPMKRDEKIFKKHAQVWQLLKEGRAINGLIDKNNDKKSDAPYIWLVMELPRGNFPCRIDLLSDRMLEFFVKYQRAEVSITFTLQELMEEAERIETGNSNS